MFASKVDLDQDCVLYGEIAYVGLGINGVPPTIYILGVILLLIIVFIYIFYKHLFVTTFDPSYASAIGVSVTIWHYALMGMVSLTTVASFEYVGSILVVAFLVIPAATAYLLTDKLVAMMGIASLVGVLSSVLGFYLAYSINGSIAAAMATVSGLFFILALLFNRNGALHKLLSTNQ
jgi:manganese/zinc/iron transport system permease protein